MEKGKELEPGIELDQHSLTVPEMVPYYSNSVDGLTTELADIIRSDEFDSKLEGLLKRFRSLKNTYANGRTILHYLAMTKPLLKDSEFKEGNVGKCVSVLVARGVDLDAQDESGHTALHYAAMIEDQSCSDALIREGADLCLKNKKGKSAIGEVLRYLPNSFKALEERLDSGITGEGRYSKDDDDNTSFNKTVTLNFNVLLSKSYKDPCEGNILTEILNEAEENKTISSTERKHLGRVFLHPLTECFIILKWHEFRLQYWSHLILHGIFSLIYSFYAYLVYSRMCDPLQCSPKWNGIEWMQQCNNSNNWYTDWTQYIPCNKNPWEIDMKTWTNIVTSFMICLIAVMCIHTVKEIERFVYLRLKYFSHWENRLSMLIIFTFPFIILHQFPKEPTNGGAIVKVKLYQYHVAAIGILLTWILNMLYVARSLTLGSYVRMMVKVGMNFVKLFFAVLSLLIAFAGSFSILFPREASMNNMLTSPLKVLSMMAGEIGYNDLMYRTHWILKKTNADETYLDTGVIPQTFPGIRRFGLCFNEQ